MVSALDAGIGQVLQELDRRGLSNNTLVILASDNGAWIGSKKPQLEVASNQPFREGRTTVYESGIRTPCIIRWPGRITENTVCREPLINIDLFALALYAAGAEPLSEIPLDGLNPLLALRGESPSHHQSLYFRHGETSSIRKGDWKLVRPAPETPIGLYDLSHDFAESDDHVATHPTVAAQLWDDFVNWLNEMHQAL